MAERNINLENFFRTPDTFDGALNDYLKYCDSTTELRAAIHHLIEYRDLLRESEISQLQTDAEGLLERLREIEKEEILAEIRAFKDILTLHRRLLEANGLPDD